ncbi:putative methyltransferase YdaC [Babylonia areolata]|uniref:putative methyltransferase YdaC n=1 Tax=Babylonia areolata TaxID=304850 RepID=UPI003FD0869B
MSPIDSIARQLRLPTKGLFGLITFHLLRRTNSGLERVAARLSAIEPHHNVLELGFGPGAGIEHALKYVKDGPGKIHGVDLSEYMLEKASAQLQAPIQAGKVELKHGNVMALPYDADSFHRVFHVNCYYFWPDLGDALQEIYRVMKPGGMMVTALSLKGLQQVQSKGLLKYGDPDYVKYMSALELSGFKDVRMEQFSKGTATYEAIFAHRPDKPGAA